MEFFPDIVLFEGTGFDLNRIMMIRILVTIVIVLVFWLGTRKMSLVPGRGQSLIEMGLNFVREGIVEDLLGKKDGARFLPLITTMFFMMLAMNLTGIVPGLNIAGTSVIGIPLLLALVAYVTWIYAGLKKHPGTFLRNALFPPGVPWPLYIIVTPMEFISTFIVRPVTHTLRLMMNMVVGHSCWCCSSRQPSSSSSRPAAGSGSSEWPPWAWVLLSPSSRSWSRCCRHTSSPS